MSITQFPNACIIGLVFMVAETSWAQPTLPDFASAQFSNSTSITNRYSPFLPGVVTTYSSLHLDPLTGKPTDRTVVVEVLPDTRIVAGVTSRVVRDRVFEDGRIIEDTFDWFAQDDAGNVWYLGEEVTDFEYDDDGNLTGTNHEGMWEAGVDGALPGFHMPASPAVGNHYYQEFYLGVAEDIAQVTGVNLSLSIPYGNFDGNVLRTRESTALEPDVYEEKFYAPGIGLVRVLDNFDPQGDPQVIFELTSVKHVPESATGGLLAGGALSVLLGMRQRHATAGFTRTKRAIGEPKP